MNNREITIQEIIETFQLAVIGKNLIINGLNLCNRSTEYNSVISYIMDTKYIDFVRKNTKIKALFISKDNYEVISKDCLTLTYFIVDNPEDYFYELHSYLYHNTTFYNRPGCKPQIGNKCIIHETAVIEDDVTIGDNVTIGAYSVIKQGTIIGNNTIIGCGSIVGADGFQLLKDKNGNNYLAKHVGGCILGQNVFIGDNVKICNSLFEGYTKIGDNTKIDSLVHIAHNSDIGRNCVLTAGVCLAGSVTIQDNVWIAPNATISNKVILEKEAFIGIGSIVISDVIAGSKVFTNPARRMA